MRGWLYLAGAIAATLLLAGVYAFGRHDGASIEIAKQAAIEKAVMAERRKREDRLDQVGAGAARLETKRGEKMREIIRETNTITERPVYRSICVDADGVRALDRAAAAANGEDTGSGPAITGEAAPAEPPR